MVDDFVRGQVTFAPEIQDDLIILRTDGSPTYHLSVVCDDIEMRISHVIRGEDHLSNTPKHIALFRALEAAVPAFGHLPLIMGTNKKRLSKRTGASSCEEFRDQGILPQALYNYLALLGWSPGDDRETFSRAEMIEVFTAERLGSSAAVFDPEKLAWMNAQYMSGLDRDELLTHAKPFLDKVGLGDMSGPRFETAIDLHRTRAKNLDELARFVVPYFEDRLEYDVDLCGKFIGQEALPSQLDALVERYAALETFGIDETDQALRALATSLEVKPGLLIHPTRMALSGEQIGTPAVRPGRRHGARSVGASSAALRRLHPFAAVLGLAVRGSYAISPRARPSACAAYRRTPPRLAPALRRSDARFTHPKVRGKLNHFQDRGEPKLPLTALDWSRFGVLTHAESLLAPSPLGERLG